MLISVLIVTALVSLCIHGLRVVAKKFEEISEHMQRYNTLMDELDEIDDEEEEKEDNV